MATPTSLTVENITAFASTLALPQDGLAQLKSSIKLGEPVHNASTLLRLLYPTLTHLPTSPAYTESQKSNWFAITPSTPIHELCSVVQELVRANHAYLTGHNAPGSLPH